MAKRKSSGDAAVGILIITGIIVWAVYAVIRVLININERFIEAASGPAGVIGLFFGLLLLVSLLIRLFIYRGFKQRTAELEQARRELEQQEKMGIAQPNGAMFRVFSDQVRNVKKK